MSQSSHHSASGRQAVKDVDDLQRLTRAVRVEAAYLRSVPLDVPKQRRAALPVISRRPPRPDVNPTPDPRSPVVDPAHRH
jgi:hypothetical protein